MPEVRDHWDKIYRAKQPDEVSWYRAHLTLSLQLIEQAAPDRSARIIDVGGGGSTLVDDLLAAGYRCVTVLDVSPPALDVARRRLGRAADAAQWSCGDVTTMDLPANHYDVWHDRAVFHFLTEPQDRSAYVTQVVRALQPHGHVIIATFGPEGPRKCSGLDVVRYDADSLHEAFGPRFRRVRHLTESHRTPAGAVQQFVYCQFERIGEAPH